MGSLRLFRLCLLLGSVFMLFLIILYWDEVGHAGLHLRTSPPAPPPPLPPVLAAALGGAAPPLPLLAATTGGSVAATSTQLAWTSEDKGYAFIWDTDAFDREVMADPDPPETRPTRGGSEARPPQRPVAKPPEVGETPKLQEEPPEKAVPPPPQEVKVTPTQGRLSLTSTTVSTTTTTTTSTTSTTTTTTTAPTTTPAAHWSTTSKPSQAPSRVNVSTKLQLREPHSRDNVLVSLQSTEPHRKDNVSTNPKQATEPHRKDNVSTNLKQATEPHRKDSVSTKPQEAAAEPLGNREPLMMSVKPQSVPPTPPFLNLLGRQAERRRHLQEACAPNSSLSFLGKQRSFDQIPSQALDHLIVDDRHGVIYCYVPKVACTNWKRVMIVLGQRLVAHDNPNSDPNAAPPTPYRRPQDVPSELSHNGTLHLTFNKFWRRYGKASRNLMHAKLRKYTKFLFVRDPFVRLMSAFRNKLAQPNEDFYRQFSTRMLKKRYANVTRPLPLTAREAFKAGLRPSFADFVHYLLDPETEKEEPFNEHWRQVYRLCHPCQIGYDFVGKLETLEEDAQHLLHILDVDREIQFPPGYRNRTAASWEHDWFANVPLEDRRKLYELYEPDFRLFGYPRPDTLLHE